MNVIKRILNSCRFITEYIHLAESYDIMLAKASNNILLFNLFNTFNIEPILILYPL